MRLMGVTVIHDRVAVARAFHEGIAFSVEIESFCASKGCSCSKAHVNMDTARIPQRSKSLDLIGAWPAAGRFRLRE